MRTKQSHLWQCRNATQNTVLGHRIIKADTYWTRLCGLLPRHSLEAGEGLWIVPCRDIHSIGMRFVFDAVFLSADRTVVHTMHHIKPWRISPYIKAAHSVLELDAGVLEATHTQIGDTLVLEPLA